MTLIYPLGADRPTNVFKVQMLNSWGEFDDWHRQQRNSLERRTQNQCAENITQLRYEAALRVRDYTKLIAQLDRADLKFTTARPTPYTYEVAVTHIPTGYTASSSEGAWHGASMHCTWLGQKNSALRALLERLNESD